ncbi:MAG: NADH-quinone oxidoreductase subunit J [Chloroflexota bacterium]
MLLDADGRLGGVTLISTDFVLFLSLAIVAVVAAGAMLMSRNSIYSALFLVINFITVAVLYLLMNAAFIAMVQVTVYAGAIMVLFLFVIMLLGAEQVEIGPSLPWQRPIGIILAVALVLQFVLVLFARPGGSAIGQSFMPEDFGSPASVGELLFEQYLIPFEVTSILLLAAMVGAIVLTRAERPR